MHRKSKTGTCFWIKSCESKGPAHQWVRFAPEIVSLIKRLIPLRRPHLTIRSHDEAKWLSACPAEKKRGARSGSIVRGGVDLGGCFLGELP